MNADLERELDDLQNRTRPSPVGERYGRPIMPEHMGGLGGRTEIVWAKITGGDQAEGFTWDEQEGTASGSRWRDLVGGRNSTDDGPAYLTRNIIAAAACVGCVVRLFRVRAYNLETEEYGADWRFEPPLPTPTTTYMVLAVDDDGYWHEDDVRSPPPA